MGYLNACSFTYNGVSSKVYDLKICWDGGETNVETGLEREISKGEVNMVRHVANQYGTKYSSVIPIEFMILKDNGEDFTSLESRTINKWLQTDTYCPLKFDDNDGNNLYYKAICTNIEDVVIGGFIAKSLTFECDSPFAYEDLRVFAATSNQSDTHGAVFSPTGYYHPGEFLEYNGKVYKCISSHYGEWNDNDFVEVPQGANMRVFNTSDDGIYYPTLKLKPLAAGEITIENTTDGQSMTLDIPAEYVNQTITIDTSKMQILDGSGKPIPLHKLGWIVVANEGSALQSTSFYWLRLLKEINRITITGNCTLEIDCEFPRKAGVL